MPAYRTICPNSRHRVTVALNMVSSSTAFCRACSFIRSVRSRFPSRSSSSRSRFSLFWMLAVMLCYSGSSNTRPMRRAVTNS